MVYVIYDGLYLFGGFFMVIGEGVIIGYGVVIYVCIIEDYCLIGMYVIVFDGVVVKKYGFVGVGSLVLLGKVVGECELWLGNFVKCVCLFSDK